MGPVPLRRSGEFRERARKGPTVCSPARRRNKETRGELEEDPESRGRGKRGRRMGDEQAQIVATGWSTRSRSCGHATLHPYRILFVALESFLDCGELRLESRVLFLERRQIGLRRRRRSLRDADLAEL